MDTTKNKDSAEAAEWRKEKRRLLRQIVGAGVLFAAAAWLWIMSAPPVADFDDISVEETVEIVVDNRESAAIVEDFVAESLLSSESGLSAGDELAAVSVITESSAIINEVIVTQSVAVVDEPQPIPLPTLQAALSSAGSLKLRAGVFRQKDNAERLLKKLQAAGFSTMVEDDTKTMVVYVVDLADTAAKAAAQQRIKELIDDGKSAVIKSPSSAQKNQAVVQIGAFSKRARAEKLVAELHKTGYGAELVPAIRNGVRLFRVVVPAADAAAANMTKQQLIELGYAKAYVVERYL